MNLYTRESGDEEPGKENLEMQRENQGTGTPYILMEASMKIVVKRREG